jgi:hypothetical protein
MSVNQTLRRVPWTCCWGRFGGPVHAREDVAPGFLFWVCGHPQAGAPRLLDRDSCTRCDRWEPVDEPKSVTR